MGQISLMRLLTTEDPAVAEVECIKMVMMDESTMSTREQMHGFIFARGFWLEFFPSKSGKFSQKSGKFSRKSENLVEKVEILT